MGTLLLHAFRWRVECAWEAKPRSKASQPGFNSAGQASKLHNRLIGSFREQGTSVLIKVPGRLDMNEFPDPTPGVQREKDHTTPTPVRFELTPLSRTPET